MSTSLSAEAGLHTYKLPLKAPVLLVCSKCQRRLKRVGDPESLVPLKKLVKRISRQYATKTPSILKVPCMKLCPGHGLVVLTPEQLALRQCTILRTRDDAEAICTQLSAAMKNGAAKKRRRSDVVTAED